MKIEYKWKALSVTTLGALISVLDGTIFIIALPSIMIDLNADFLTITWIIMGYLFIATVLVPTIGRIADMVGRKWLYLSGFIIFTVASLFCGTSASGSELLLFRMFQAVGGSFLMANSVAIVTDAFPKNELGTALGINSTIFGVGAAIGPVLGGLLLQFGWRFIFFINIPTGIIGTIWGAIQLKEVAKLPKAQKFDWLGTILFTLGMLGILIMLSFGGFIGWLTPMILTVSIVGITSFLFFIWVERRATSPMMDLRLFQSSRLAFNYSSVLLNAIARGAVAFLLTFFFQVILSFDPLKAGLFLTPFAITQAIGAPISGRLADRYGSRGLTAIGLGVSAGGLFGLMFISTSTAIWELIIWMLIMGLGSGMFFSPNAKVIMEVMPPHKRGIATSVRTMLFNAGNVISLGLALAIISSAIPLDILSKLFLGLQVGSEGVAIEEFITGIRIVFALSFSVSIAAAVLSAQKGKPPQWKNEEMEIVKEGRAKMVATEEQIL